jgi:hypothetical protein
MVIPLVYGMIMIGRDNGKYNHIFIFVGTLIIIFLMNDDLY